MSGARTDVTDRTVLVTGGAGFVGSHLAAALVDDNEVRVLDDLSAGDATHVPDDATLIEGDVRDPETLSTAMAGVDVVFHEAALVSVPRSIEDPLGSNDANLDATVALLEGARDEGARVVVASSAAIYGHPESVPVGETHATAPTSPYGVQKLAVDHYTRLYAELYGLDTVALRYFNVYGPRQSSDYSAVISVFAEQARADEPLTVEGDGEQTRDFVHVSDVVRANLRAATTDHVGEAFNVGTGERVTIRELAETVREVAGADSEIVHVDGRAGDVRHSCANVDKARALLGYEPAVGLREGLRTLFD